MPAAPPTARTPAKWAMVAAKRDPKQRRFWVDSTGRCNTLGRDVGMAGRHPSDRALRSRLYSPGRPPVAQQEHRRRFWVLIATGQSSEDAAIGASVSAPVGVRWFRKAGGMPPSTIAPSSKPLSGRYLSFAEREEIAIQHAQGGGVRQMGRSGSTISRELRRNAATRGGGLDYRASTAQWHAERAARRPKPAKLAVNATLRTYVQYRLAGLVVTSSGAGSWADGILEGSPTRTAERSALGLGVESRADCPPPTARFPSR